MSEVRQADLEFCWQKVLQNDPWFRLHFTFVPRQSGPQYLALHALFCMLDGVAMASDESLIAPQLGWWQSELSPDGLAASAHPVVRVLRQSGALERLATEHLEAIIASVLFQSQADRLPGRENLEELCNRVGEARILPELALGTEAVDMRVLRGRCAGTGLSRVVTRALQMENSLAPIIPLELQARHQVDRHGSGEGRGPESPILESMVDWAESWFDEQTAALGEVIAGGHCDAATGRHLVALTLSERLRLVRSIENMKASGSGTPGRWGVADFVRVWRQCRKLAR